MTKMKFYIKAIWATVISHLRSDRYWSGYFHKIWVEQYCLGENPTSWSLSILAAKSQNFINLTGAQKYIGEFLVLDVVVNMKMFMFLKFGKKTVI